MNRLEGNAEICKMLKVAPQPRGYSALVELGRPRWQEPAVRKAGPVTPVNLGISQDWVIRSGRRTLKWLPTEWRQCRSSVARMVISMGAVIVGRVAPKGINSAAALRGTR